MTRASPSTKVPRIANKIQANRISNVNETRTETEVVVVAPMQQLKKRAKKGSVMHTISRIKEAAAVARTTNLSSNRDEVVVELLVMDSPSINKRDLRRASRISLKVQHLKAKVQPKCKQDLLKQDLSEVVWDKTKPLE